MKFKNKIYRIVHFLYPIRYKLRTKIGWFSDSRIQQKRLQFYYQNRLDQKLPLPKLNNIHFRKFSQTEEDGILHYIFSLIGTTNKVCLDIIFNTPYGSNTTNLIVNLGWKGILICATERQARWSKGFFTSHKDALLFSSLPMVYPRWITVENLNEVVKEGLNDLDIQDKEIDLFSLDIDGVDYWIWNALEIIEPRVVILEFNYFLGNRSITIPYKPDFRHSHNNPFYSGASLPAFVKLAKKKGYRLVGVNKLCYNAFFIKNDIGEDIFPEVSYKEIFNKQNYLLKISLNKKWNKAWNQVKDLEWIEI